MIHSHDAIYLCLQNGYGIGEGIATAIVVVVVNDDEDNEDKLSLVNSEQRQLIAQLSENGGCDAQLCC